MVANTVSVVMMTEQSILEAAMRIAQIRLRLGTLTTHDMPKLEDVENMNALQMQAKVDNLEHWIDSFRTALKISSVGAPSESVSNEKERLKQWQIDNQSLEKGLDILNRIKAIYWRKLLSAKLKQPLLASKIGEAERIIEEANRLNAKIVEEAQKLKQMLSEMEDLKARYNRVYNKFQKINLDPDKQFPPFDAEVSRNLRQTFR